MFHNFRTRAANSLFFRYFRLITIVLVISVSGISVIILGNQFTSNNRALMEAEMEIASSSVQSLESIVTDISFITSYIHTNLIIHNFLTINYTPRYNSKDLEIVKDCENVVRPLIFMRNYINSAYLYSPAGDSVLVVSAEASLSRLEDFFDKDIIMYPKINSFVTRPMVPNTSTTHILSYVKPLRLSDNQEALVVINMSLEHIGEVISSRINNEQSILISNNEGEIIYSSDKWYIGKDIHETMPKDLVSDSPTIKTWLNGRQCLITVRESTISGLCLWLITPADNNNNGIPIAVICLSLFLIAAVSTGLAYVIALRIAAPIETLLDIAESPDMWEEFNSSRFDFYEFKHIVKNITARFHSQKEMESQLAKGLSLLRKAQSLALYSQITPHFLFNTLQAINLIALETFKADNDISDVISLLADMLRISLRESENMIPLKTELRHAECYVLIQKKRYADLFDVEWSVESELSDFMLPKVLLQPLIENSIYHGIKPKISQYRKSLNNNFLCDTDMNNGKVFIKIKSSEIEPGIDIIVEDNGVGMTKREIDKLHEQLEQSAETASEHIGLLNVDQRIKITYGVEHGLNICQNEHGGVTVQLFVPKT